MAASSQGGRSDRGSLGEPGWCRCSLFVWLAALSKATSKVSGPTVLLVVLFIQAVHGAHAGVLAHPQLRDHALELVGIGCSCLAYEEARATLQLQAPWGPSKRHPLELLTVHIESHGAAVHAERQVCPLADKPRQAEAGRRVRLMGARLRVEQGDVLVPVLHPRELHAQGDHRLSRVRDGEQHPGALRGWLDVEQQGEVAEGESGEVVLGRLATAGVQAEDIGRPHVRVVGLRDLPGQRVPEELQQSHLLGDGLWGCWWHCGSPRRCGALAQGGCSPGADLRCPRCWRAGSPATCPEALAVVGGCGA